MQAYLMMEDLWEVIDEGVEWPNGVTVQNQWVKRDQKAYSTIYFTTYPNFHKTISSDKSGWDA
jgi:hypothetical protein